MASVLDEQIRRSFVAMEARSLGHGGVSAMVEISGLARSTIFPCLLDITGTTTASKGNICRPGGGRKSKLAEDPTFCPIRECG